MFRFDSAIDGGESSGIESVPGELGGESVAIAVDSEPIIDASGVSL